MTTKVQMVVYLLLLSTSLVLGGISRIHHYQDNKGNYDYGYTIKTQKSSVIHRIRKPALVHHVPYAEPAAVYEEVVPSVEPAIIVETAPADGHTSAYVPRVTTTKLTYRSGRLIKPPPPIYPPLDPHRKKLYSTGLIYLKDFLGHYGFK